MEDIRFEGIKASRIITAAMCVVVAALMVMAGKSIHKKIAANAAVKIDKYTSALQITTKTELEKALAGDGTYAFIYGTLEAADTVTLPELDGEYMYIEKSTQKYSLHVDTTMYPASDGNGGITYKYMPSSHYSWDTISSKEYKCKNITFLGATFPSDFIKTLSPDQKGTSESEGDIRYKYYLVSTKHTGTVYTWIGDGSIAKNGTFYENKTIQETLDKCVTPTTGIAEMLQGFFWGAWICAIGLVVYAVWYVGCGLEEVN